MSDYRRYDVAGGTYFFTLVTERRAPLFAKPAARILLGSIFRRVLVRRPFRVLAIVLLPDHLHAMWELPPGDDKDSSRWNGIKKEFTYRWLRTGGIEQPRNGARRRERRRGVWQRR